MRIFNNHLFKFSCIILLLSSNRFLLFSSVEITFIIINPKTTKIIPIVIKEVNFSPRRITPNKIEKITLETFTTPYSIKY